MPSYRRPIRISASKLPVRLTATRPSVPTVSPARLRTRPPLLTKPAPAPTGTPRILTEATLSFTLPVPPSINHQYATVRGRRLLSSAGRSYKAHVGQLVWLSLAKMTDRAALLSRLQTGTLTLSIRFYFTSALRRDVDGGLKIAQDALCEGLGVNDNRIVETHLYKHVDKTNPRIEVCLTSSHPSA